jgi:pyrrolidone-carboxylate peptidase
MLKGRTPHWSMLCLPGLMLGLGAIGCGAGDELTGETEDDVRLDTSTAAARAQYDENMQFARNYLARCPAPVAGRKRVLVTGFGRFLDIGDNATGRMISSLVPAAKYPESPEPVVGKVSQPSAQLSVGTTRLALSRAVGDVDVCGMILPVFWDLAPVLIAKEIERFKPDFVLMNGVAGPSQPLWLEMGAVNLGKALEDGSGALVPAPTKPDATTTPLVPNATPAEYAVPNLGSFARVQQAAIAAIEAEKNVQEEGTSFRDLAEGAALAGFPRVSNTYLCNNVTYTVNYLMDHPGRPATLMQASVPRKRKANSLSFSIAGDYKKVPRFFVHWPSALRGANVDAGARVMRAMIEAQLADLSSARRGDNTLADPSLRGGDTF